MATITVSNVMLLVAGLVVVGIGTIVLMRPILTEQIDEQLRAYADRPASVLGTPLRGQISLDDIPRAPTQVYVAAIDSEDATLIVDNTAAEPELSRPALPRRTAHQLQSEAGQIYEVTQADGGVPWHVIVSAHPAVVSENSSSTALIVVAMPLTNVDTSINSFLSIFTSFGILAALVAATLTRLLVSNALLPLRDVERSAAAIAEGNLSRRLAGASDLSEVGRLKRSLNIMLSRLDRAFADRDATLSNMQQFVGDASHELRTPLVTMRGYAELYRMGVLNDDEAVRSAMERIEREALRMSGLVEDLLQLSRLDGPREIELTLVDLEPIVEGAVLDTRATDPSRRVLALPMQVSHRVNDVVHGSVAAGTERLVNAAASGNETLPMVLGEEMKISQAVQNLIGNALRYTPAGSPLEVGIVIVPDSDEVRVDIVDHGEGVDPAIREKIFERFWRADSSRQRETGGTGLGLAIVAAIAAQHKATVNVVETPGGGATFRIFFPLLHPTEE